MFDDYTTIIFDNIVTNYGINRHGEVINYISGKKLEHQTVKGDPQLEYPHVKIMVEYPEGPVRKTIRIHQYLGKYFIPNVNPKEFTEINHIDGDKTNFSLDNLEWVTHQYNIQHAYDNGLIKPSQKLDISKVCDICEYIVEGLTNMEIQNRTGVKRETVAKIRSGSTWLHVSKNYPFPKYTKPSKYFNINELEQLDDLLISGKYQTKDIIDIMGKPYNNSTRSYVNERRKKLDFE